MNTGQKGESTTCEFLLGELGRLASAKVWLGAILGHRRQLNLPSLDRGAAIRRFDRLYWMIRPLIQLANHTPSAGVSGTRETGRYTADGMHAAEEEIPFVP